jgi:hypothetical protein
MDIVTLVKHYILSETPTVVLPIPIRKECEHILNWPNAIAPCILFLYYYYFVVDLNDWKFITCIKVVSHQIDEQHKQLDIIILLVLRHYNIVDFMHFLRARADSMCTKYQHYASYNSLSMCIC